MKAAWLTSTAPWLMALSLLAVPGLDRLQAEEGADNVVIVLDASGSMNGRLPGSRLNKMAAAKAALKEVLKNVPQATRVGLLVFSASNVQDDWVYPLGPRNDPELFKAIDLPAPGRGTPLGRYIKIGADRLLEERARQFGYGTFRLLIVTDGEAEDRALVEQYTPDVIGRGITVDVIGVAMSSNHTLARKVHSYRAANDATSLRKALSEVFAEVGGSRGDTADADVFALLAPIPAEIATAAIQALSTNDNRPIGAKRQAPQGTKPRTGTTPQSAPSQGRPAPAPQAAVAPEQNTAPKTLEPARKSMPLVQKAAIAVVLLAVTRALFGRRRNRR